MTTTGQEKKDQQPLLSEFPSSLYQEWHEAAIALLKGVPFEKKMYTNTYEGIPLKPIYMKEDGEELSQNETFPGFAPYLRGTRASGHKQTHWHVAQEIAVESPSAYNCMLKQDLLRGQNTVHLILDAAAQHGKDPDSALPEEVGKNGVSLSTLEDLQTALEGIDIESHPVYIHAGSAAVTTAALFAALVQKQGASFQVIRGCIGLDPLGMLIQEGKLPYSLNTAYRSMAGLTSWAAEQTSRLRTILVDGSLYHDSGGNAVQELAFVMATAVEYLRAMITRGLSIDTVAPRIQCSFSAGTRYFMEIAKLRAARLLWAKVMKAFGGNDASQKMAVHLRTSSWNKTAYDPYVNMLRTTIEAFAGIMGGCESLSVSGFDAIVKRPDEFSRRIARNTHTILREEVHVHEVLDPAGGSWYIEHITDELARKAWSLFQEVEQRGGMLHALQTEFPQDQIRQTATVRTQNLSTRKDVLIGTNMYANPTERRVYADESNHQIFPERAEYAAAYRTSRDEEIKQFALDALSQLPDEHPEELMNMVIQAVSAGATLGEIEEILSGDAVERPRIPPLKSFRGAEIFERLRDVVNDYTERTSARPRIFLANMGPVPQHKARADFSTGFFEVGGFEIVTNNGFLTADEAAEAAISSDAPVVVICSTDDTYPEIVPVLTRRIKRVKPDTIVILAGYPKESIETFREAGIDEFIHLRANAHEILTTLMKRLNILA